MKRLRGWIGKQYSGSFIVLLGLVFLSGCATAGKAPVAPGPSPVATPTPVSTSTLVPVSRPSPVSTPVPRPTPVPTPAPAPKPAASKPVVWPEPLKSEEIKTKFTLVEVKFDEKIWAKRGEEIRKRAKDYIYYMWDKYYPYVVQVFGPPREDRDVVFTITNRTSAGGLDELGREKINFIFYPQSDLAGNERGEGSSFGHEIVHVLFDFPTPYPQAFDEGFAKALGWIVYNHLHPDAPNWEYQRYWYDFYNQPALSCVSYYDGARIRPQREEQAGLAWTKVWIEYPNFFRDFRKKFQEFIKKNPEEFEEREYWSRDGRRLDIENPQMDFKHDYSSPENYYKRFQKICDIWWKIAGEVAPIVEGLPWQEWVKRNFILQRDDNYEELGKYYLFLHYRYPLGTKEIIQGARIDYFKTGFRPYAYINDVDFMGRGEKEVAGEKVKLEVFDIEDKLVLTKEFVTDKNGVIGHFDIDLQHIPVPQRLKFKLSSDKTSSIVWYPAKQRPPYLEGLSGTIVGVNEGTISVTYLLEGTKYLTEIKNGNFTLPYFKGLYDKALLEWQDKKTGKKYRRQINLMFEGQAVILFSEEPYLVK